MSRSSTNERTTLYEAITGGLDTAHAVNLGLLVGSSGKIHARSFAAWLHAQPSITLQGGDDIEAQIHNRAVFSTSDACGFVLNLALDGLISLEFALWSVRQLIELPPSACWEDWKVDAFNVEPEDARACPGIVIEGAYLTASLSSAFDRFTYSAPDSYAAYCKGRVEARELFGGVI